MAEESTKMEVPLAPAVICSYCSKLYKDEDKHDMGFERDDWAVCLPCFRKACDAVSRGTWK